MLVVLDQNKAAASSAPGPIRICSRCSLPYDWRKSTSYTLKMTYCTTLCEYAGEGFLLERYLKDDVHRLLEDVNPEDAFPEIEPVSH